MKKIKKYQTKIYEHILRKIKGKNVDNNQERHKCSYCGKVRYEKFMVRINDYKTRPGHYRWMCKNQVNNPDYKHSKHLQDY